MISLMNSTLLRGVMSAVALAVLQAAEPAQHGPSQDGVRVGLFDDESPLPQECAHVDRNNFGRPLLIDEGGILYGLSMKTRRIPSASHVPAHFWIVNPTDKLQYTSTCDVEWFIRDGINVVDAEGHLALSPEEQKDPAHYRSPTTCRFNYVCSLNYIVELPPHSCKVSEHPSDLAEAFVLGAGQYAIVPREIGRCGNRNKASEPVKAGGRLVFSIDTQ